MILTDEGGKKYELFTSITRVRCVRPECSLHDGVFTCVKDGDTIVRPLPPPAKTVEEALDQIYDAFRSCAHSSRASDGVLVLGEHLRDLIAAVRAEEAAKRA